MALLSVIFCFSFVVFLLSFEVVSRDAVSELKSNIHELKIQRMEKSIASQESTHIGVRLSRKKRDFVYWPDGAVFTSEFSFEVPIASPAGVAVPFLIEVPYTFDLPNSYKYYKKHHEYGDYGGYGGYSEYGGHNEYSGSAGQNEINGYDSSYSNYGGRSISNNNQRLNLYKTGESLFKRFGLDGQQCMLRAICERAESHFLSGGLIGEILSLFLTVSSGENGEEALEYLEAEYTGKTAGNCSSTYNNCPISIFHWLES